MATRDVGRDAVTVLTSVAHETDAAGMGPEAVELAGRFADGWHVLLFTVREETAIADCVGQVLTAAP